MEIRNNLIECLMLIVFSVLLIAPDEAGAIPAFSRKYQTSCVTCHIGFPKLSPFGEAFRINGFRWMRNDEEMTKEELVKLGSDAYKRVFPDAVWPSEMPGTSPVSFRAKTGFKFNPEDEITSTFMLPTLQIMTGGTFDENISFFAGAHLFEENQAGSIDRFYILFSNLLTNYIPENILNIRFGQFIPDIVPFASNHRGTTLTAYAFNTFGPGQTLFAADHAHGGSFGLEAFQIGTEASGLLNPRLRYTIGLVNGNGLGLPEEEPATDDHDDDHGDDTGGDDHSGTGDNNSSKDIYGRVAFKLGGLNFEGTGSGSASKGNWVDNSLMIGVFVYNGNPSSEGTDLGLRRTGIDFSLGIGDFFIYGGFISGYDEMLMNGEVMKSEYSLTSVEVNWVIYPWFLPTVRYEIASPDDTESFSRVIPSLTLLVRSNIKIIAESTYNSNDSGFKGLNTQLEFAF